MSLPKTLVVSTNETLDAIQEIKFFIKRYIETKNEQCLKMAKDETIATKNKVIEILMDEESDQDEKRKEDAMSAFVPLLETLISLETFLNEVCGDAEEAEEA